ncbi:MAG: hypothetical protein GX320_06025 [Tissierellia bacterium]|nr:hypothetical protein [Tissierellia bacterium]
MMQSFQNGFPQALKNGLLNTIPYAIAIIIGTILVPMLLPILPFRAFSMKGLVLGVIWSVVVIKYSNVFYYDNNIVLNISNSLLLTSIISFLALNFTGSTTFTSLSGVKKETLIAVPVIATSALVGVVLMIIGNFL